MKLILKKIFQRMNPKLSGVYGLAGIVLILLGLFGFSYGAAFFFWPLAVICFSLIVYPTLFCWGIVTGAFSAAAITYIGFTIFELTTKGQESTIFSDGILVYLIYITIIILIPIGLFMAKPSTFKEITER